jgi:hypothetical protein
MDSTLMAKCIKYAYRDHTRWREEQEEKRRKEVFGSKPFLGKAVDVTNKVLDAPFEAMLKGASLVTEEKASIHIDFDRNGYTDTPSGGTCWWILSTGPKGANRDKGERTKKEKLGMELREFGENAKPVLKQAGEAMLTATVAAVGGGGTEVGKAAYEIAQPIADTGFKAFGLATEKKEDMHKISKGGSGARAVFAQARGTKYEFDVAMYAGAWSAGGVAFFNDGMPPRLANSGFSLNAGDVCLFLAYTKNMNEFVGMREAQHNEARGGNLYAPDSLLANWIKATAVGGFRGYGIHTTLLVTPITKKAHTLEAYRGMTPLY